MLDHNLYKEWGMQGRYITMQMLKDKCFSKLSVPIMEIGTSVNGEPILGFQMGKGRQKILMWSQMHGNESTTTKAVWDLVNFLQSRDSLANNILETCTLMIVPMLNPDGAKAYTRQNSNGIDLNRDAKNQTQPESRALRQLFEEFQPNFCFNLHDQRTLFSAGNTAKPATVSFLSPASNPERDVTPTREVAMRLIVAMDKELQKYIPGQVGRYDDGFNDNCVGDSFQMTEVPTILFEAGHFPGDYSREKTREYIFYALVEALKTIGFNEVDNYETGDYFKIPENQKWFFDILVKRAHIINPALKEEDLVGINYKEVLRDNTIQFEPELVDTGILEGFYGHETLDCGISKEFEQLSNRREIIDLLLNANK